MSEARWIIARRQLIRLVLLTAGLAPVVAAVLLGLSKLQRDTPEWVYWKAELIVLIALELSFGVTACLSLLGTFVLGFLMFRGRGRGASRPLLNRGLMLCIALVCSLALSEAVCAVWISRSHRSTAVPVGGLGIVERSEPLIRFSQPLQQIDLRSNFPDPPDDHEIDLVVLGESSAAGLPYNRWLSIGKIVAWKLREAIPDRPIRLNVIARSGDTLEMQHKMLSSLTRRPDLVIIYCGHNEFYSRLWWARNIDHYSSDKRPARWEVLVEKIERYSSLGVLLHESADRRRIALPPPSDTRRDVVDVPSYTAFEYIAILTDFRHRLEEMVSYAERVGAMPVLVLPPGNDAGFEPNRSFLPPATPRAEREAFGREILATRKLESVNPRAAIEHYRALIRRQPCFAEAHYRLGRLLEEAGAWEEAYQEYVSARDLDGLPMRCPSPFQEVYREVAARHGCVLIDGQAYFHAIGRHGLLDDELFQDAMHPSLRGHIALAQAVLVALRAKQAFGWRKDSAAPIVDPAQCVAQFGIDKSAWKIIAAWSKGFNELMSPLRYDRDVRMRQREAAIAATARIDADVPPEAAGLPNVGVPAGIPVFENGKQPAPAPVPTPGIMPCLLEVSDR